MNAVKISRLFLIIPVGVLLFSACEEDIDSSIRGWVIDASGEAVTNTAIAVFYGGFKPTTPGLRVEPFSDPRFSHSLALTNSDSFTSNETILAASQPEHGALSQNYPNPFLDTTYILFQIPQNSDVKIWITDYCKNNPIRVLVDGYNMPGKHQVLWDGKDTEGNHPVNGAYYIHMSADGFSANRIAILSSLNGDAITDEDGYFEIEQECEPFGAVSTRMDKNGYTLESFIVSRYVDIWAIHNSYKPTVVESVYVDPLNGAEVTIQFSD